MAGPLRGRPRHPRPGSAGQRRAVDDRRRHAGRDAVPAELRYLAALAADRCPGPPRQPDAVDRRPAGSGRRARRRGRRGARAGGAAPPAVSGHERAHGRPRPDVQRLGEPRRRQADHLDVDGRGGVRSAHRLRQRRQPADCTLGAAGARGGHPGRAGRHTVADRPPVAGGEPRARRGGQRRRPRAGRRRHPPARHRHARRRQAVLDDLPPRRGRRCVPRPRVRRFERALRAGAGAARLEDAGQRAAAGRGAHRGRRGARAPPGRGDGGRRGDARGRPVGGCGPDDPQFSGVLSDRSRVRPRSSADRTNYAGRPEVPRAGGSAPIRRAAPAAPGCDARDSRGEHRHHLPSLRRVAAVARDRRTPLARQRPRAHRDDAERQRPVLRVARRLAVAGARADAGGRPRRGGVGGGERAFRRPVLSRRRPRRGGGSACRRGASRPARG